MNKLSINNNIAEINNILKKDDSILAAYLFGSQAKGSANKYSDFDIGILFDYQTKAKEYTDRQIAIINSLSAALHKEVDAVILNRAPVFLKYHILKEGIKVYERPHRPEHSFEANAIIEYFDFLPVKNRIEGALIKKIKEG